MKFPLNNLINTSAHLGHHNNQRNPYATPYIYGTRRKIDIINLQETLINFYPIANIISQTIQNRGSILTYSTDTNLAPSLQKQFEIHKQPYITGPWIPGTLSNFKSVIKSKHFKKYKNFSNISTLNQTPNLIIILNKLPQDYLIIEANKLHIPIIALTDTNTPIQKIPYILPTNDDSTPTIQLFIQLFTQAILRGYASETLSLYSKHSS